MSKEKLGETTRRAFLGTATVATAASLTGPTADADQRAVRLVRPAQSSWRKRIRMCLNSWRRAQKRATGQSLRRWPSPKKDILSLNRDDTGQFFRNPANYGFTLIAKIKPGREETIRAYGKTIENAIAGDPFVLAPLRLHYLRWVLFNIGSDTYFMYQGIFDTDFDKYTEDAIALFTSRGRHRFRKS